MLSPSEPAQILLVEGKYDFHILKNLLKQHKIEADEVKRNLPTPQIGIVPMETKDELGNSLELYLSKGNVTKLGIVIDADDNPTGSYDACYNNIAKHGEIVFVDQLPVVGSLIHLNRANLPSMTVGIWIMPDNQQPGMLEHFASALIPDDDKLWPIAQQSVANLPEKRFPLTPNDHTRKAELHTWLAWQEEPGKPMGLAVTFGYLKHNTPLAQDFIAWVRALFLYTTFIT